MLKVLKTIIALFCFTVSLAFVFQDDVDNQIGSAKLKTVVIDAGHGGHDSGTKGKVSKESDVTLKIALTLGKMIKENLPEVRVLYTRDQDVFVELGERSAFANRMNADLFISIHCNSSPSSKSVKGTETFVMGLHKSDENLSVARRENSVILKETNYKQKYKGFDPDSPLAAIMLANYQNAYITSSLKFADHVERKFRTVSSRTSRGVKQAGFLVLWRTSMPSVLIETGFLSTPEEEKYLNSSAGQKDVATSIYQAFRAYKQHIERL
jgi:N-acetylmuramoyl-L-alanine amidase